MGAIVKGVGSLVGGAISGSSKKKAAKNTKEMADTQFQYNKDAANLTAQLNRYDETNPYGTNTWTTDPVTGKQTLTQKASPQLQSAIDSSFRSQTAGNNAATGAINRVASTVGTKFDTSGLPQAGATPTADAMMRFTPQSNVPVSSAPNAGPVQTGLGNTGSAFGALFGAGAVPDAINVQGGQYQSGVQGGGNIMSRVADAGPINQNVNLQTSLGDAGGINQNLSLQKSLDYGGAPSLYGSGDVSADYNSAVSTAFGAQKANIDEAYGQQRKQLEQSLADKGIPLDSEAARFQMAQLDKNRDAGYIQAQAAAANTGLNTQSTLSGLSLANRGQIVGETNTQGQFGNDAKTTEAGFNNQGQNQKFAQMLASGQFGNEAMLAGANYGLAAQGQQYGQNANNTAVNNAATQQQFNQNLAQGQFANDATGRQFADQLAAAGQNYGQQANTQATRFGQQSGAQSEAFDQSLAAGQFYNQGQGQGFNQGITAGQFANTAQQQQFDQNRARLGDYNSGAQADFNNSLASSQQQNALRGQEFDIAAGARAIPVNEALGLMRSQQQTPQLPGVNTPAIGVAAPDFMGANQTELAYQRDKKANKMGAAGDIASAGFAMLCWVAREVYGDDAIEWVEFRSWMLNKAPKWLLNAYARHGERFALFIADKPRVKSVLRFFMDKVR